MSEQIAVALIGALGALLVVLLGAVGFLLKRRITRAGDQERAAYLNAVADLRIKLNQAGLTPEQIGELETFIQSRPSVAVVETLGVTDAGGPDDEEASDRLPRSYWSTYAMVSRARARLDVTDARIAEQLVELRPLLDNDRWEKLQKAQKIWQAFRRADAAYAATRHEGGTLAPLIGALRQITIAEHRLKELESEVEACKTFGG